MQVIGLCRFSYPAAGGFQRIHETNEERRAYLYADARLTLRFRLFESFCLPSIANQTDTDFTFIILIGTDLPLWAKERLHTLTRPYPWIQILAKPTQRHRDITAEVINEAITQKGQPALQFRLDDDDAVNVEFVELAKANAAALAPAMSEVPSFAIDYCTGFSATIHSDGLHIEPVTQTLWTPALAAVFKRSGDRTIMNFGHHKLFKSMPVVSYCNRTMFIRSFHTDNDSVRDTRNIVTTAALDDDMASVMKDTFGIDHDRIKQIWSDAYSIVPEA